MSLTNLYFSNRAPCNVASVYLELSGNLFLSKTGFFAQLAYIISYLLFDNYIHTTISAPILEQNS